MKKRLLTFIFASLVFVSSFARTNAFGGYTHYYISSKVVSNISDSDEYEFKNKMVEIAKESDNSLEKWFALGWSDHVVQDYCVVKTFKNIFKEPTGKVRYRINCGKLDAYFYNKTGYLSVDKLNVPHDLISRTYKRLSEEGKIKLGDQISFSPNKDLIGNEIRKILWTFYLASWLGIWGLYDEEIEKLTITN